MGYKIKIISGGQTGVDRAALDAAIALGFPYGGLIPKGRISENGPIPTSYNQLEEAEKLAYIYRTEQNVIRSDATLILGYLPINGGTQATNEFCHQYKKPHTFINLKDSMLENTKKIIEWLKITKPKTLNIAGPRESKHLGIYKKSHKLLESVLKEILKLEK